MPRAEQVKGTHEVGGKHIVLCDPEKTNLAGTSPGRRQGERQERGQRQDVRLRIALHVMFRLFPHSKSNVTIVYICFFKKTHNQTCIFKNKSGYSVTHQQETSKWMGLPASSIPRSVVCGREGWSFT